MELNHIIRVWQKLYHNIVRRAAKLYLEIETVNKYTRRNLLWIVFKYFYLLVYLYIHI
jgi:hypothetical protein